MSKDNSDINIDLEILRGIEAGNNLAIQKLYKLYFPPIAKMIINNQGSREEAQDIFQETVMVLYDRVTRGNFELSSKLQTFLYAVSKRLWLKQLTRGASKYHKDLIDDLADSLAAEEAIEEHAITEANFLQMEDALNSLGEPCKTILQDFYLKNASMADICEKFGYTNPDNAKNQKYKCLQRLKKMFFKK
ncbi:sigma-70 family RNA polymerase sigma factor [Sphingobacterium oryzagri]|uniref:Sigma-70 family RNA polymerase sigma factor n=1 Tax=Sphingobacterium oryzagri TaxID=3025669 RepID=A0ABY7WLZ3_9SPHI|nr:sigma-70 family RNA polymerase sigma factor [Sphingobacterium sp. KACC 22765]WDF69446.1 sigma-70 family RNA polymerase sigma factor [Sphingobacterium sp. KACC 22765]